MKISKVFFTGLFVYMTASAVFSADNNAMVKRLEVQAKKAMDAGMNACRIEDGSDYEAVPMVVKMRNPDSTIKNVSYITLDGTVAKSTRGSCVFNNYTSSDVTINGSLNYEIEYINGSTENINAKYKGTLVWKWAGAEKIEATAVYDYSLKTNNGKMTFNGSVKINGITYNMKPDGSVDTAGN